MNRKNLTDEERYALAMKDDGNCCAGASWKPGEPLPGERLRQRIEAGTFNLIPREQLSEIGNRSVREKPTEALGVK